MGWSEGKSGNTRWTQSDPQELGVSMRAGSGQGQRQLKAEQRKSLALLEGEGYNSRTRSPKGQGLMRLGMELEASEKRDQGEIHVGRAELPKGAFTLLCGGLHFGPVFLLNWKYPAREGLERGEAGPLRTEAFMGGALACGERAEDRARQGSRCSHSGVIPILGLSSPP